MTGHDVTAHELSPDFYRALFEHGMEAVLLTAPDGRIFAANPACCKMFGLDEREICARGRAGLVDPDTPQLAAFLERRLAEGHAVGEVVYFRGDGTRFVGETSSAVFLDEELQPRSVIIIRDVTAQRTTEAKYRSVVMSMAEGVVVQDAAGNVIEVNPAAEEIEGRGGDDMIGHDSDDPQWGAVRADGTPFPGDEHPSMATLRTGEPQTNVVMGITRPNGERRWISINSQPVRPSPDRPPDAVVATFHDITDQRQTQSDVEGYVHQLESAMESTLRTIAAMVELRDPYTAGHMQRVATIARDLAAALGWDERRCQMVEFAGMVHDVGKIAVPAELLTKPTALNQIESQLIQSHAEWSYTLLRDGKFPLPIAEIVHQHHERLDGSGYPQGLRGDQIVMEARVLAVADMLESMAAFRPYRAALGLDAALAELHRQRGSALDVDVVDALDRMLAEGYQLPSFEA